MDDDAGYADLMPMTVGFISTDAFCTLDSLQLCKMYRIVSMKAGRGDPAGPYVSSEDPIRAFIPKNAGRQFYAELCEVLQHKIAAMPQIQDSDDDDDDEHIAVIESPLQQVVAVKRRRVECGDAVSSSICSVDEWRHVRETVDSYRERVEACDDDTIVQSYADALSILRHASSLARHALDAASQVYRRSLGDSQTPAESLADDLWARVFTFLNAHDHFRVCAQVCRKFRRVAAFRVQRLDFIFRDTFDDTFDRDLASFRAILVNSSETLTDVSVSVRPQHQFTYSSSTNECTMRWRRGIYTTLFAHALPKLERLGLTLFYAKHCGNTMTASEDKRQIRAESGGNLLCIRSLGTFAAVRHVSLSYYRRATTADIDELFDDLTRAHVVVGKRIVVSNNDGDNDDSNKIMWRHDESMSMGDLDSLTLKGARLTTSALCDYIACKRVKSLVLASSCRCGFESRDAVDRSYSSSPVDLQCLVCIDAERRNGSFDGRCHCEHFQTLPPTTLLEHPSLERVEIHTKNAVPRHVLMSLRSYGFVRDANNSSSSSPSPTVHTSDRTKVLVWCRDGEEARRRYDEYVASGRTMAFAKARSMVVRYFGYSVPRTTTTSERLYDAVLERLASTLLVYDQHRRRHAAASSSRPPSSS